MKGCILFGRFVWSVETKNRPPKPERAGETCPTARRPEED
jgi:hypothetical protein